MSHRNTRSKSTFFPRASNVYLVSGLTRPGALVVLLQVVRLGGGAGEHRPLSPQALALGLPEVPRVGEAPGGRRGGRPRVRQPLARRVAFHDGVAATTKGVSEGAEGRGGEAAYLRGGEGRLLI